MDAERLAMIGAQVQQHQNLLRLQQAIKYLKTSIKAIRSAQ